MSPECWAGGGSREARAPGLTARTTCSRFPAAAGSLASDLHRPRRERTPAGRLQGPRHVTKKKPGRREARALGGAHFADGQTRGQSNIVQAVQLWRSCPGLGSREQRQREHSPRREGKQEQGTCFWRDRIGQASGARAVGELGSGSSPPRGQRGGWLGGHCDR